MTLGDHLTPHMNDAQKPTPEERFRMWFERPFIFLEHGRKKDDLEWNGAYIALSIGFFLCERYYRIKMGTTESISKKEKEKKENEGYDDRFKHAAAAALGISPGEFIDFWLVFRNGIQHQGMPKRLRIKNEKEEVVRVYGHAISVEPGFEASPKKEKFADYILISVNPWKFTQKMMDNFLNDQESLKIGFEHALAEIYEA